MNQTNLESLLQATAFRPEYALSGSPRNGTEDPAFGNHLALATPPVEPPRKEAPSPVEARERPEDRSRASAGPPPSSNARDNRSTTNDADASRPAAGDSHTSTNNDDRKTDASNKTDHAGDNNVSTEPGAKAESPDKDDDDVNGDSDENNTDETVATAVIVVAQDAKASRDEQLGCALDDSETGTTGAPQIDEATSPGKSAEGKSNEPQHGKNAAVAEAAGELVQVASATQDETQETAAADTQTSLLDEGATPSAPDKGRSRSGVRRGDHHATSDSGEAGASGSTKRTTGKSGDATTAANSVSQTGDEAQAKSANQAKAGSTSVDGTASSKDESSDGDSSQSGSSRSASRTDPSNNGDRPAVSVQAVVADVVQKSAVTDTSDTTGRKAGKSAGIRVDGVDTTGKLAHGVGRGDRSERATESQDGPRVDVARFVGRVAKAFQTAQQRGGTLQLRLSPPELGTLRLELSVHDGALTASLEAETTAARRVLLDHLPALRDRLAEQNIRIERFDVDVRRDDGGGQADGRMQQRQQQSQNSNNPESRRGGGPKPTPIATAPAAARPAPLTNNGGLNVVA